MKICLSISILLLIVFSACTSVKPIDNAKRIFSAKEIEGNYNNASINHTNLNYHNLSRIIDFQDKTKMADVTSVEIKILNDNEIEFLFTDKYGSLKRYNSKYFLEDGKLYLKNKNFRLTGIPYLFGGYKVNKTTLAKGENGDLLISAVQIDEGAFLFVIPASTPKSYFQNSYSKN